MWKLIFCALWLTSLLAEECPKWLLPAAVNHPVSTQNPEAQNYFNLGLTNVYAFNHELAFRMFENASQLDPNLAMAYWGMALSLGQNINEDITKTNEKRAFDYSQKAISLLSYASQVEKNYVQALAVRYAEDPNRDLIELRRRYKDAMQKLSEQYPEDLDALCLYAESIMNINPWKFWKRDGKPEEGILDAIALLESILKRDPDHLGGNHFNIHAWEESETPERALLSAFRLTSLYPYSGHLLHMPCHIFLLCGFYKQAIETSKKAIEADLGYISQYGTGNYPIHYLPHNYRVLTRAYLLAGDYEKAIETANEMVQFISPHIQSHPNLADNLIVPMEANLYFEQWNKMLELPKPSVEDPYTNAFYHFGRALAFIRLGDVDSYQKEKASMEENQKEIGPESPIFAKVIKLGRLLLDAEEARGKPDYIAKLKQAVEIQDNIEYSEPPFWYLPLRLQLGEALIADNNNAEAEAVFQKGLQEYQRNPRFLRGLYKSLKNQNKDWDAFWVESQIRNAK